MSRRRFPLTPKNLIPSVTTAAQKPPAPHRSFADVVDHCCIFIDGIRMPGELKQHAGALEPCIVIWPRRNGMVGTRMGLCG